MLQDAAMGTPAFHAPPIEALAFGHLNRIAALASPLHPIVQNCLAEWSRPTADIYGPLWHRLVAVDDAGS